MDAITNRLGDIMPEELRPGMRYGERRFGPSVGAVQKDIDDIAAGTPEDPNAPVGDYGTQTLYYQLQLDRLNFARISGGPLKQPRRGLEAAGTIEFDAKGPLYIISWDEPVGHSVDLDGTGYQLTDEPQAYEGLGAGNPIPIKSDGKWVEI